MVVVVFVMAIHKAPVPFWDSLEYKIIHMMSQTFLYLSVWPIGANNEVEKDIAVVVNIENCCVAMYPWFSALQLINYN